VSIDARLSRLTPALSARERAILILGSLKDDTPEDSAWRRTMPQEQVTEFNRYIGLMNVANRELSLLIGMHARTADELGVREGWLVSLILWQEHVEEIREALHVVFKRAAPGSLRRIENVLDWRSLDSEAKGEHAVPEDLIAAMRRRIAGQTIGCWVQLRTCETMIEELRREFGGVDPMKPYLRAELEQTKQELLTIQEHLSWLKMKVVLREPLEEELEDLREWVKQRVGV
jgi:hypothetical protein